MSVSILTHHNDNRRTGANLNETQLHSKNINVGSFQKLFELPVDGQVFGQPLYVSEVDFPGLGLRHAVYAATMHNSVYCFDAIRPGAPLWQVAVGPSIPLPNPSIGPAGYKDIEREVGILSTPAISRERSAIYVVAATLRNGIFAHHLHALDLRTGAALFGGPRLLAASVPGNGAGSINGTVHFLSNRQIQRAALLLANEAIYISFAAYGDQAPYHGWILGYSADTLQPLYVYNTTPEGEEAGIWQAGHGPAADEHGNIYVMTGNGTFNVNSLEAKVTLPETSAAAPPWPHSATVWSWPGPSTDANPQLRLAASTDARRFDSKVVLNEHAVEGPALASDGTRLFIAWTGTDDEHRLNIMSTGDLAAFKNKVTLPETSAFGPALAYGNGRLFLAWTGTDAAQSLNLASSVDGVVFQHKVTLPETSAAGPTVAFLDGKLYLLWISSDNSRSLNILEYVEGSVLKKKLTLADSSDFSPAIMQLAQQALLFWTGRDAAHSLNLMQGSALGSLRLKDTYGDRGAFGPAAAEFLGQVRIAWTGTDPAHRLNVAQLGGPALGDAFVKLRPNLTVSDWFSPFNTQELSEMDADLGSGGVLLLPESNLAVGGGKEGKLYLLDRSNFGRFNPEGDTQIVQSFQAAGETKKGVPPPQPISEMHHIHGSPGLIGNLPLPIR